jgi:hypothetical protein
MEISGVEKTAKKKRPGMPLSTPWQPLQIEGSRIGRAAGVGLPCCEDRI